MEALIAKGQKIKNLRSGNTLECYNVCPVIIGTNVVRYDYSFFNTSKRFKTIKHSELMSMIEKRFIIV